MFASKDNGTTRKVFQKPNILRRKPKAKRGAQKYSEPPQDKPLIQDQINEEKPLNPAKINVRIVTTEYPIMSHGATRPAVQRGRPDEVTQAIVSDATCHSPKIALGATAQSDATTYTYSEPPGEVQAKVSNDRSIFKQKPKNTCYGHELYMGKPSTLFGQQVDFKTNNDEEKNSLNIESFLVDSPNNKSALVLHDSSTPTAKKTETEVENKWCLNFMSDDSKDMITPNFYDVAQIKICTVNSDMSNTPISFSNETNSLQEAAVFEQDIIQSCLNSRVIKYKCDIPNCNKSFWNEARLQKHKTIHLRQKTSNTPTIVECPVKRLDSDGVELRCGKLFPTRDVLVKHLNEEHAPEDAAYRCTRCGRRFWWATGMRSHTQSTCTRALVCTWPGCGRVFRQPCRLREHARAHTGDRPYPCNYPNCGWAFRSASKLVRHARRHTGERRHECMACGRAFLRREHLRDHAARHHAPHSREPRPCTHEGCEQTFANMSSLYMHLKKVHRAKVESTKPAEHKKATAPKKPAAPKIPTEPKKSAEPKNPTEPKKSAASKKPVVTKKSSAPKKSAPPKKSTAPKKLRAKKPKPKLGIEAANMLVMTLDGGSLIRYDIDGPTYASMSDVIETANASAMIIPEEEIVDDDFTGVNEEEVNEAVIEETVVEEGVGLGYDLEGRCARTHCTWPLQRTHTQPEQAFTIEEDTQVEPSEGFESNIYTVRSDLFLHGNVLINEDSEFIIRESSNRAASEAEETSDTGQLDGLDLIDSHPTIDLMQEELMYADAAVDESSFRVFLLNGEELS